MSQTTTLLLWLLKGTTVLVLAMGMAYGLRRAPAGARYAVWLAALAALLLVPVLSTWMPVPVQLPAAAFTSVGVVPTPPTTQQPVLETDAAVSAARGQPQVPATPQGVAQSPSPAVRRSEMSPRATLLAAWLSIVALLFGWLALGALKVRRIVRNGRELTDGSWQSPMYDVADRLDLAHAPRLIISGEVEMPFACGILRPTIVLPESAEAWSIERRRVVLFHELAHVRRRDLIGHTVGRVTCAVYWFHPLVWSAAKRMRAESERACDDLVLACGGARASDYATHLLDIVTGVRREGAPAVALPMADKREFEGRMLAILDPSAKRAASSALQQLAVGIGFGALALSMAAVAPTRRVETAPMAASPAPPASGANARLDAAARAEIARPEPRAEPTLELKTAKSYVKSTAVRTRESVVTSLIERASSQEPGGRVAGPDTALLGKILRTDKDADVRKAAAWALQGRRDGAPLLLERLKVDESEDVREMSAWALADMGSDQVAAALAQALAHDQSEDVRTTAAWALGQMPSRASVPALEGALSDASGEVRQRALWALGQQHLDSAPKKVVEMLNDQETEVRTMAAWVLGEIRDKSTLPAIRDALVKERDHETLQLEFRDLLLMGDRSQALIDRALASEDPEIRAYGVRLLAGKDVGSWPWPWPWPEPRPQP